MDRKILSLSLIVFGQSYTDLLAIDLLDYTDKEKKQALSELTEEANTARLNSVQRDWLTSNTTC